MTHRIQKPTNRIHSALLASLMLSGAYLAPSAVLVIGALHTTASLASGGDDDHHGTPGPAGPAGP
ncbi:MAG: hypothetical protein ABL923_08535, partial [Burkholderiaceae bacterium]